MVQFSEGLMCPCAHFPSSPMVQFSPAHTFCVVTGIQSLGPSLWIKAVKGEGRGKVCVTAVLLADSLWKGKKGGGGHRHIWLDMFAYVQEQGWLLGNQPLASGPQVNQPLLKASLFQQKLCKWSCGSKDFGQGAVNIWCPTETKFWR